MTNNITPDAFNVVAQQMSTNSVQILFANNFSGINNNQPQFVYVGTISCTNTDSTFVDGVYTPGSTHYVSIGVARNRDAANQLKQFQYYNLAITPGNTLQTSFNIGLLPGDRIFWVSDSTFIAANVMGTIAGSISN